VMPTHGCNGMGRALAALKLVIAVAFCASLATATLVGMRVGLPLAVKMGLPCILAALLLATYVAIAFGLTVAFNC
jgi:hypothetical protein